MIVTLLTALLFAVFPPAPGPTATHAMTAPTSPCGVAGQLEPLCS